MIESIIAIVIAKLKEVTLGAIILYSGMYIGAPIIAFFHVQFHKNHAKKEMSDLSLRFVVSLRNRALDAYNEIMRLQL